MTPKQINEINKKSKERRNNKPQNKDMYCQKCKKIYPQTTLTVCYTCGRSLLVCPENMPKCPTCNSINVQKIGTIERGVSTLALGLASSKIGKTMKCNNCGYKW